HHARLADEERSEALERAARLDGAGAGPRAVDDITARQLGAFGSDIGRFDHEVARDLALNGEIPLLDVRVAPVELDGADGNDAGLLEAIQLESIFKSERRVGEIGGEDVVHDARRILSLESEHLAYRKRIENAVAAAQDRGVAGKGTIR